MDKLSVHQKHSDLVNKAKTKNKKKKQPIKVVYISNPLKITLTADNFRARVQELTGRDSNVADADFANFRDTNCTSSSMAAPAIGPSPDSNRLGDGYPFGTVVSQYDQMFDEAFSTLQAPCNFPGLYYEPHVEGRFSQHR